MNTDSNRSLNSTPAVGIILQIADGCIQSCNHEAERILGYTAKQLIEANYFEPPWQTIHQDGSIFSATTHPGITSLKTGQPCSDVVMGFHKPDGDLVWLSIATQPLFQASNSQAYAVVVSFTDITESQGKKPLLLGAADYLTKSQLTPEKLNLEVKQAIAEYQLRTQHQETLLKLQLATAASGLGMWFWDLINDKLEWKEECKALFGLAPDTEISYQLFLNTLHPEDRDRTDTAVRQALSNKTEYNIEYRVIWSDGSLHWLAAKGRGFYNQNGEAVRMMGTVQDVSGRKQTEQALRNSENRLRKILDSLIIFAGIITTDGEVIEVNQTALDLASLQPEDILHKKFCETYWWSHSPENKAKLEDAIQRAAKGESVRYDLLARVGENKFILIDFSIVPVFNANGEIEYLIPSGIDVSDREASKQALKESEDELRLITEIIPQQIWTALPTGETDYINQRWQEYTGVALEQIKTHGWSSIVHPEDLPQVIQAWNDSIQTGKKYDLEARLRGEDETYRWFLGRARPLRNQAGKIIKWYGTNTDINLIKELEEKLRKQTKDLIEANRLKDEFLAIVSHELRTPLNPILGWSQLIATGKLDADKTAQGIEIIQRNAKLQSQLINDLLDVSRILRGKLDLKISAINLESIIRSAIATVQLAAEAKSIQIQTELDSNVGQVSGDAGRLQQIVWNLLANAIKFTPEAGQVTVKLKRIGTKAEIEVQDTGQGIAADFLPYVFDRFRQAESATTRKFGGLGLGLAIVRHLTEIHGGTVSVTSPGEGNGATFRVQLPLINTLTLKPADSNLVNEPVKANRLKGIKILVVEDEIDSRNILTFVLEQEGAEVIPVNSANAALQALNQSLPDLIISDIGMPEMDGYTLITQIRALPQGKKIPAIALTAYAGETDRQRSLDVGFHKYLSKPINISELIDTIMQLITDY
jgi:PAS domain S-box-containing protein